MSNIVFNAPFTEKYVLDTNSFKNLCAKIETLEENSTLEWISQGITIYSVKNSQNQEALNQTSRRIVKTFKKSVQENHSLGSNDCLQALGKLKAYYKKLGEEKAVSYVSYGIEKMVMLVVKELFFPNGEFEKAISFCEMAVQLGCEQAYYLLGKLYLEHKEEPFYKRLGIEYIHRAALLGDRSAQFFSKCSYLDGQFALDQAKFTQDFPCMLYDCEDGSVAVPTDLIKKLHNARQRLDLRFYSKEGCILFLQFLDGTVNVENLNFIDLIEVFCLAKQYKFKSVKNLTAKMLIDKMTLETTLYSVALFEFYDKLRDFIREDLRDSFPWLHFFEILNDAKLKANFLNEDCLKTFEDWKYKDIKNLDENHLDLIKEIVDLSLKNDNKNSLAIRLKVYIEAVQKNPESMMLMADTYLNHNMRDMAIKYYKKAAALACIPAMVKLGELYLSEPKKKKLGLEYLNRAALFGNSDASKWMRSSYFWGDTLLPKDEAKSRQYFSHEPKKVEDEL